jgi:hypothetical protein
MIIVGSCTASGSSLRPCRWRSAVQNIFDINIARLQIGIVQLAILLAELGQHLMPRPLRIALFLAQDIAGGFKQIGSSSSV